MTTDRLFVIMLVLLIPMTGCFGALDNADAEENTSETIVNNYYNNTTTVIAEEVEYFTVGGVFDKATDGDFNTPYYPYNNISTTAGQIVEMHYLRLYNAYHLSVETSCADGSTGIFYDNSNMDEPFLYGSYTSCEHAVVLSGIQEDNYGFSMIYSIRSATVL
ncbi:MAG: hypothetical protein ISP82_03830 [Candidatus Poseidoniaceae archaeon]|nr:hypothetical protein [Candidatus Poseidoniaceae archaeon]